MKSISSGAGSSFAMSIKYDKAHNTRTTGGQPAVYLWDRGRSSARGQCLSQLRSVLSPEAGGASRLLSAAWESRQHRMFCLSQGCRSSWLLASKTEPSI